MVVRGTTGRCHARRGRRCRLRSLLPLAHAFDCEASILRSFPIPCHKELSKPDRRRTSRDRLSCKAKRSEAGGEPWQSLQEWPSL